MFYDISDWLPAKDSTLYVARLLDLPPLTAEAAFDGYCRAESDGKAAARVLQTPSTELCVIGAGVAADHCSTWSLRQAPGRLRARRALLGTGVEVEMTRGSDTQCEIGIRPRTRVASLMTEGRRQQRYLAMAGEAASALVQLLEDRVDTWIMTGWNPARMVSHQPA